MAIVVIHLNDWLAAYRRIQALAVAARPQPQQEAMLSLIEQARAEILVARSAAEARSTWDAYRKSVLRSALADYGSAAEVFLIAADDGRISDHAV